MSLIKAEKAEKSAMILEFSVDKETFDKAVSKVYRQQVSIYMTQEGKKK